MKFKSMFNKGNVEEKNKKISSKVDRENYIDNYFPASYREEVLPIIEIIKPEGLSLSEYQEELSKDLFESFKKRQLARGDLISDPEEMVKGTKTILVSRIKAVLEDYRSYESNSKKIPDKELVKKAKIALLFLDDNSDIEKYLNISDKTLIDLSSLRSYIVDDRGDNKKLTESDVDFLLKTKYAESLVSIKNDSGSYLGDYGNLESISNSLMIALVQAEEKGLGNKEHYWAIKSGLEASEKNKYNDECLEQLLSSNYDLLCLDNSDKFSGQVLEKIFNSGFSHYSNKQIEYSDNSAIDYLGSLNLSKEQRDKYLDLMIKHTIGYKLRENLGSYYDYIKEIQHFLKDTIEKLHQIEMDIHLENDLNNFLLIKEVIGEGYLGLALATNICNKYVEKYALDDYDNFIKDISKYNQEHLVYKYLRNEDKIKYTEKLIDRGEEYLLVKFHTIFDKHSLGPEIFNKINEKKLSPSLRGDLSAFKNLSEKDALEFIDRGGVNIFINNLNSFNFSENFLHDQRVQEASFSEFEKGLFSLFPGEVRKFYDKIPFPEEKVKDALIRAIDYKLGNERIDWACMLIKFFPEIKPLLKEEKFYEQALLALNKHKYPEYIADILESFPLPAKNLEDKNLLSKIIDSIEGRSYGAYGDSEKDQLFSIKRDSEQIIRINKYIKLPKYFIEFTEVIDRVENINFKKDVNIKIDLLKILSRSKDPVNDLNKYMVLIEELNSEKKIEINRGLVITYISKFLNNDNKEDKKEFFEKIKKDISSLARNDGADLDRDPNYYEYLLKHVYPPRNHNTYRYLDEYENLNHHLDKYSFNRDGYDIKLSGIIGYKIKEGFEADQILLDEFSKRVRAVKNLAKLDNLNNFLEKEIVDSRAQTIEGKILEYFKQNNYSIDTLNVLLAYQLLGSYDDFANTSADRFSAESDKVSRDYVLLDEIANQYGDNMKEAIKTIYNKVVNSVDRELFLSDNRDKKEKKYQEVFSIIMKDLNKIPQEKLSTEIIKKKISKTIKNVFQGFPEIQKGGEYFSTLFDINDFASFQELWNERIEEFFAVDTESSIDLSKVKSLQSSVFNRIQAEIIKYEEVKEVDGVWGEVKLKKDRPIKGYFSKSKENVHARMVADVCIARDYNMLKNEKYFEFVLFDQEKNKCVGTVMLLEMNEPGSNKKYLLYSPNPSVGLVSEVSAKKLYQLLTKRISKFAEDNNFDAVLIDKAHGRATNRAGLFQQSLEQSCLKNENGEEIVFNLEKEHSLNSTYSYQNNLRAVWIKD